MAITNSVSDITRLIRGLINDRIKADGRDSWVYSSDNEFTLSEFNVSSSTIIVFKNGTQIADQDWSYDSDSNKVTISFITSGQSLSANDVILITYSYYEKFSDTEIEGYLESSLSYFAQYKYKKIFELTSSDTIVAETGLDPTTEEIYFISLIASIVIDPQNIRISIPDLSLDAKRDKSDQDQIKDAFNNFSRFVAEVNFTEYEDID